MYIARNLKELDFVLQLAKVSIDAEVYGTFKKLENDEKAFKTVSLEFTRKIIDEIKHLVPGFHFFTMNGFEMVARLVECEDFASV